MRDIYNQHDTAFKYVSAYVILDNETNERVATVAFKFPRDGASRLWCYVHVIGLQMVRGYAGGYGYDKKSSAFTDALEKQAKVARDEHMTQARYDELITHATEMLSACNANSGADWQDAMRNAGYKVLSAV